MSESKAMYSIPVARQITLNQNFKKKPSNKQLGATKFSSHLQQFTKAL